MLGVDIIRQQSPPALAAILPPVVLIGPPPEKSGPRRFFGVRDSAVRDVRRLSNPPLPAEDQTPCDSYKRPVPPQAQLAKTEELLTPSRRGRVGVRHNVMWSLDAPHHTPRLFVGCTI